MSVSVYANNGAHFFSYFHLCVYLCDDDVSCWEHVYLLPQLLSGSPWMVFFLTAHTPQLLTVSAKTMFHNIHLGKCHSTPLAPLLGCRNQCSHRCRAAAAGSGGATAEAFLVQLQKPIASSSPCHLGNQILWSLLPYLLQALQSCTKVKYRHWCQSTHTILLQNSHTCLSVLVEWHLSSALLPWLS